MFSDLRATGLAHRRIGAIGPVCLPPYPQIARYEIAKHTSPIELFSKPALSGIGLTRQNSTLLLQDACQ
jgi:hypothetical protein